MARVLLALLAVLLAADERTPVPGFFDLPVTGGTATFEMLGCSLTNVVMPSSC